MAYSNYQHRGSIAPIEDDVTYRKFENDYDEEYSRFDFKVIKARTSNAIDFYASHKGPDGTRGTAPNVYINQYVRQRCAGVSARKVTDVPKVHKKQAERIWKALRRHSRRIALPQLYRAMDRVPEQFCNKVVGDIVTLDTIVSCSASINAVAGFGGTNGMLMVIKNASGIPVRNGGEYEFVLAPGSRFAIDDTYRINWRPEYGEKYDNITVFELTMSDII